MKDRPLMKCGHTAQGTTADGKPYCVICDCAEVENDTPDLTGRQAKCCYCGRVAKSDYDLPFFEAKPDKDFDEYYCGCEGWD